MFPTTKLLLSFPTHFHGYYACYITLGRSSILCACWDGTVLLTNTQADLIVTLLPLGSVSEVSSCSQFPDASLTHLIFSYLTLEAATTSLCTSNLQTALRCKSVTQDRPSSFRKECLEEQGAASVMSANTLIATIKNNFHWLYIVQTWTFSAVAQKLLLRRYCKQ